jgi:hypothetical protein
MSMFYLAQTQENSHVPVIAENVGPYSSLEAALAAWPGFHEASDEEYAAYVDYWDAWYADLEASHNDSSGGER